MNNRTMLLGTRLHVIEESLCSLWTLCLFLSVSRMEIFVMKNTRKHLSSYPIQFYLFFVTFLPFLQYFFITYILIYYLTIIPRARMGSVSIAHEAESRMGY